MFSYYTMKSYYIIKLYSKLYELISQIGRYNWNDIQVRSLAIE